MKSAGENTFVRTWLPPLLIAAAALIAYLPSFRGVFVFDDPASIAENGSIRRLWPPGPVLSPPYREGQTVGGRPVLNLSLAVNYAISGMDPWSYHALNLAIQVFAGLTLFGILRRMARGRAGRPGPPGPTGGPGGTALPQSSDGTFYALVVAMLWTVHPLQTESVTYVIQRAESMMGMFYLLTVYCFIRYAEGGDNSEVAVDLRATVERPAASNAVARRSTPTRWAVAAILACLLGMATKEVMVSAPLVVFLYDRTFLSGSFRESWRRHRGVLLGLALAWIPLGLLVLVAQGRGGTSGLGLGVSWGAYVLTQFPAILRYLRLAIWPHPLIFDYGAEWVKNPWTALPAAAAVLVLLAGSLALLFGRNRARRHYGFAGVFFFLVLAPSSLVPGLRQTVAEHRMYLALAPLLAVLVAGVGIGLARWGPRPRAALAIAVMGGFIALTQNRNRVYGSELALWRDTVDKLPHNPYAQNNLGTVLRNGGQLAEARQRFTTALRLKPDYAEACNNLGNMIRAEGRPAEALEYYEKALRHRPRYPDADNNRAVALTDLGRLDEAQSALASALRLKPDYLDARYNLAAVLADQGKGAEAIAAYEAVLQLKPDYVEARMNLGNLLAKQGRLDEAMAQYREGLRIRPGDADIRMNLANVLVVAGRRREAEVEYETVLRLRPGDERARLFLERVQAMEGGP